jgi:hypothetical protein
VNDSEKNEMTESFPMRLTRRETYLRESGFNATEGCDLSVPAHGILMKTYREIMREYSNSRISSGQNEQFADALGKEAQYQSVHDVPDSHIDS